MYQCQRCGSTGPDVDFRPGLPGPHCASCAVPRQKRSSIIECPLCEGEGTYLDRECPRCGGHGKLQR